MGKMMNDELPSTAAIDDTPAAIGEVTDGVADESNTTEAAFENEVAADAGLTTLGDITEEPATKEDGAASSADSAAAI